MSLKNGFHQLINSLKVSISNNEILNSQTLAIYLGLTFTEHWMMEIRHDDYE